MLGTRPDLAFSVSTLSKFSINPDRTHAIAINRILRYLKKTIDVGITYGGAQNPAIQEAIQQNGGPTGPLFGIHGFTDSDWAGDKDTRKSTSGFLFTLYGGAISWRSAKQSVTATSSTKAEYIASSEAAKEALWIKRIMTEIRGDPIPEPIEYSHEIETQNLIESLRLKDLQTDATDRKSPGEPQVIFADNQGAIKLSKNPQHHKRTKHIDVKYHFIRESTQSGLIQLIYIPTDEMVADILTKALPRDRHEKHMKGMGLDSVGVYK